MATKKTTQTKPKTTKAKTESNKVEEKPNLNNKQYLKFKSHV